MLETKRSLLKKHKEIQMRERLRYFFLIDKIENKRTNWYSVFLYECFHTSGFFSFLLEGLLSEGVLCKLYIHILLGGVYGFKCHQFPDTHSYSAAPASQGRSLNRAELLETISSFCWWTNCARAQ